MRKIYLLVFLLIASINGNSQAIMAIYPDTIDFGSIEYGSEQLIDLVESINVPGATRSGLILLSTVRPRLLPA